MANYQGDDSANIYNGGADDDVIEGNGGNDRLTGGDGDDRIDGGDGDDELRGNDGNDVLLGGAGSDFLIGGSGLDQLDGGAGNDFLGAIASLAHNSDIRIGDTVDGGEGFDIAYIDLRDHTSDLLIDIGSGDFGPLSISNVEFFGGFLGQGNDRLVMGSQYGNSGTTVHGYHGIDTAVLDFSAATFNGNAITSIFGDDTTPSGPSGEWFDVTMYYNDGESFTQRFVDFEHFVIHATNGDDSFGLPSVAVEIHGLDGNDHINGSPLDDVLYGDAGNDNLYGADGDDVLYGGNGSDTLMGWTGNNILFGGAGFDVFILGNGHDIATGGEGPNVYRLQNDAWLFADTAPEIRITDFNAPSLFQITFPDVGPGDAPIIYIGRSEFSGTAGEIRLTYSETEAATMLLFDTDGDGQSDGQVVFEGIEAVRPIHFDGWFFYGDIFQGTGEVDNLTGTDGSDQMFGLDGNDHLDGKAGNDELFGGAGDDTYLVDSQSDVVFENANEGEDTVLSTSSFYLYDNIEDLTLEDGAGDLFGVGNSGNNTINGNDGDNLLIGGDGGDELFGNAGNDSIFGQEGHDLIAGGAGIDYLVGGAGNDILAGGTGADALYGGDGNDQLYGSPGIESDFSTDILVGGAGDDHLFGNSGLQDYDLMDGGSGDDHYFVDTGDDLTFEAENGGTDIVYADVAGENNGVYLYANVENLVLEGETAFGVGNELDNIILGSGLANWLLGGDGDDTIDGGAGNDVLFGEGGADTFQFNIGSGGDVIGDFAIGEDQIEFLWSFGISDFEELQTRFIQNGNDGAIYLRDGDFIVLNNVQMDQLTEADFLL